jgi:hypothetical protein
MERSASELNNPNATQASPKQHEKKHRGARVAPRRKGFGLLELENQLESQLNVSTLVRKDRMHAFFCVDRSNT